ncbi:hypothetical protein Fcan01_25938 [Folsomia candida]|uniref:Uncharacterized protein n=1 Tax=Folsomia candida TaxID=158441 RepID=A0A226D401_FOLCA|nr:hypothetical protein Fcan01_25938 [Folsomia candida]
MISSLNSPLPNRNIPQTFQDLLCQGSGILKSYKEGANLTDWILQTAKKVPIVESTLRYKILSDPKGRTFEFLDFMHETFNELYLLRIQPTIRLMEVVSLENMLILQFIRGSNTFVPRNYNHTEKFETSPDILLQLKTSVTTEVVKCGKSVLVVDSFEIGFRFNEISKTYSRRKFYKGKEILNSILITWTFEGEGNSKVPQYFQYLFESGIQGRLDMENLKRKHSRNSEHAMVKSEEDKVRLGGAILTLFILCGILIGSSILSVVVELRKRMYWAILRIAVKISNSLRMLFINVGFHIARCTSRRE